MNRFILPRDVHCVRLQRLRHVLRGLRVTLSVIAACLIGACQPSQSDIQLDGLTMGTTYSIRIHQPPAHLDGDVARKTVVDVLAEVDRQMSHYRADSTVSQFNAQRTTEWVVTPIELAEVVAIAEEVRAASQGAFDITASARAADATGQSSAHTMNAAALHVRQHPPALRKSSPEIALDLDGVAPGYAVDWLARRFDALGAAHYLIEIGGEVRTKGARPTDQPWRIAVERPLAAARQPYVVLALQGQAVSTSGEYQRLAANELHPPTIDPSTGQPIDHSTAAVVVIAADAARADAWSTALNVLGVERGLALAAQRDMAVMFIEQTPHGLQDRRTPAFKPFVVQGFESSKER